MYDIFKKFMKIFQPDKTSSHFAIAVRQVLDCCLINRWIGRAGSISFVLFLFYLPYLFSIYEKANCIAILWTGSPHSLGSCLFGGLWATCLSHKGGGIPLSALPKDTTSELAGLFSTTSPKCRTPSTEAVDAIFLNLLV